MVQPQRVAQSAEDHTLWSKGHCFKSHIPSPPWGKYLLNFKKNIWNKQNILKTIAGQNSFITLDKIM